MSLFELIYKGYKFFKKVKLCLSIQLLSFHIESETKLKRSLGRKSKLR